MNCCCNYGAAVAGEWPEFECADCERHGGELEKVHRCRRHRAALAQQAASQRPKGV